MSDDLIPKEFDRAHINSELERLNQDSEAKLQGFLRLVAPLVPHGSMAFDWIFGRPSRAKQARINELVHKIVERVERVESDANVQREKIAAFLERGGGEDLQTLMIAASNSRFDGNSKYYVGAFFRLVEDDPENADLRMSFVDKIASLSPRHFFILEKIVSGYEVRKKNAPEGKVPDIEKLDWVQMDMRDRFALPNQQALLIVEDLISMGYLIDDGPGRWGGTASREYLKPTQLGAAFVAFLSESRSQ